MDIETLLGLAQNALDEGNIRASCEFYEAALQKKPDHVETLEAYGEVMAHYVQDAERARQLLLHAVQMSPDNGYVKYLTLAQMAQGHTALGFYETGFKVAERDHSSGSNAEEAGRCLSNIKVAMAELYLTDLCDEADAPEQCEKLLRQAERHCSWNAEVYQTRASLRLSEERPEDCFACLQKAVQLCMELPEENQPPYEAQIEIGKLLMQVQPTEAFKFLLVVLNLNDANPYVWFLLGETARLRKRFEDSARLLRRARAMVTVMSPDDADALTEIDNGIRALVEDMGGPEAASNVPDLDHPQPLELLVAEEDDDEDDDWVDDDDEDTVAHVAPAKRRGTAAAAAKKKRGGGGGDDDDDAPVN